jgi:flagellar biosynthesis protein
MSKYKLSPNKAAVALKYNPDKDYAPVVVASGHGPVADKIIEVADQNGVPIFRDDSTAAVLTMLNVGQQIPESLYEVIAGIYVEILKATNELKENNS